MDEQNLAELTQRLDRLEQENRWWRRLVVEKLQAAKAPAGAEAGPESPERAQRKRRGLKMAPGEYIASVISLAEASRNHRERMGYLAATVYAAAALWLTVRGSASWREYSRVEIAGILVLLVALGWLGLAFVRRQLARRREAAEIATAARNLAARWLRRPPAPRDLRGRPWDGMLRLPRILCEEIARVRDSADRYPRRRERLTLGVLVVLWVAATLKVLCSSVWGAPVLAVLSLLWTPPPQ